MTAFWLLRSTLFPETIWERHQRRRRQTSLCSSSGPDGQHRYYRQLHRTLVCWLRCCSMGISADVYLWHGLDDPLCVPLCLLSIATDAHRLANFGQHSLGYLPYVKYLIFRCRANGTFRDSDYFVCSRTVPCSFTSIPHWFRRHGLEYRSIHFVFR